MNATARRWPRIILFSPAPIDTHVDSGFLQSLTTLRKQEGQLPRGTGSWEGELSFVPGFMRWFNIYIPRLAPANITLGTGFSKVKAAPRPLQGKTSLQDPEGHTKTLCTRTDISKSIS